MVHYNAHDVSFLYPTLILMQGKKWWREKKVASGYVSVGEGLVRQWFWSSLTVMMNSLRAEVPAQTVCPVGAAESGLLWRLAQVARQNGCWQRTQYWACNQTKKKEVKIIIWGWSRFVSNSIAEMTSFYLSSLWTPSAWNVDNLFWKVWMSHPAEVMKRGLCNSTLCTNNLGSKVRIST